MLYNFIIVDDDKYFLNLIKNKVKKVIDENNYHCNISIFNDYNKDFYNCLYEFKENKIYILDIEVPSRNGIEVAREIRKLDLNCKIIFISAFEIEYSRLILKSNTEYYASILKENIENEFELKLTNLLKSRASKILKFVVDNNLFFVEEEDIIYIAYIDRKCFINTNFCTFSINKSLNEIYSMLSSYFLYSHKACIINMRKVIDYSVNPNEIIFSNGKRIDLISRKYIKVIDDYYTKWRIYEKN